MGGETEDKVSGWTVDTLHVHLDQKFRDLNTKLDERHRSQQEMVRTALDASDKRFESVNEFREQQKDIIASFVTRVEYTTAMKALGDKVDTLSSRVDSSAGGQASVYRLVGWGLTAAVIIIAIVSVLANVLTGS